MSVLYGNYKDSKYVKPKVKKKRRIWLGLVITLVILIVLYLVAVFSNIPFIKKWRTIYIQTAMSTMRHQWLATYFIPSSVIEEAMGKHDEDLEKQYGVNSTDPPDDPQQVTPVLPAVKEEEIEKLSADAQSFYKLFWELDVDATEEYFKQNPKLIANGYGHIKINEAGLDDDGLELYTSFGEQVLAIDAENEILLVRVKGDTFRGVLAIAKDPAQLHLYPAKNIGSSGETAGKIAERYNGLIAMTGNGFIDDGGVGNGGDIAGYCVCDGQSYGRHYGMGYKRIELHENNWLYIADAPDPVGEGTTDATEFTPSLIVNGERQPIGEYYELNPRACIGQSKYGEILMIACEGRFIDSLGCSVAECADIMLQHEALTAMNLDGGTSAILWYEGEPVIRCSNTAIPQGRNLPNAWVYVRKAGTEP